MKTVLITGAKGFIGKNLQVSLQCREDIRLLRFDKQDDASALDSLLDQADFVFHLAGVNRPQHVDEFRSGNKGLTERICTRLSASGRKVPILLTSSIQAERDNPYGVSKKAAEEILADYNKRTGAPIFIYRLPGVFGKWSQPNYNTVVATFCHNIANDLPIQVNDPNVMMNLVYIDDVVSSFIAALDGGMDVQNDFCQVQPVHTVKLGDIAALIRSFKASREDRSIPDMSDPFTKKLYSTYLSYLPTDRFSYPLTMNVDERGSFTEFIKTVDRGQVSINISKPGITKGNHWHHTKNEKFLVVSGSGVIRFRKVDSDEIIDYQVSGDRLEVIEVPTGYTHNITNAGETDMVTVMWANEAFDLNKPDTFFMDVKL